jgi:hypothetical protein
LKLVELVGCDKARFWGRRHTDLPSRSKFQTPLDVINHLEAM